MFFLFKLVWRSPVWQTAKNQMYWHSKRQDSCLSQVCSNTIIILCYYWWIAQMKKTQFFFIKSRLQIAIINCLVLATVLILPAPNIFICRSGCGMGVVDSEYNFELFWNRIKTSKCDDATHVWWYSRPPTISTFGVIKNGRGWAWFGMKAWSDQVETWNKRNAFLPFILKGNGLKPK